MQKPLIIFDLNGIFIDRKYEKPSADNIPDGAQQLGNFLVWKRPGLTEFLDRVFQVADVGVWSSVNKWNADLISKHAFGDYHEKLVFVFDQSLCVPLPGDNPHKPIFLKNLSSIWEKFPQYNASNTLIIDDSDAKMVNNPQQCYYNPGTWKHEIDPQWDELLQHILKFALKE